MIKKGGYDNVSLNVMLSFGSKEIDWLKKIPEEIKFQQKQDQ